MVTSSFQTLTSIENDAPRAGARQLKVFIDQVQAMRLDCDGDDAEYADALLLKLTHLLGSEAVAAVDTTHIGATEMAPEFLRQAA